MKKIIEVLKDKKVLVSDGAWGTFLHAKGLSPNESPELWNIERPADVLEIAKAYVDAGANMILTNSFGGSRLKLKDNGLAERTFELNKAAAEISRKAAGDDIFVLGSIGPTGRMIMMGDTTPDELYDVFKEQSMALAEGGANAILIETMSDMEEATIAVKAAKENTDREVICTFTFEKTPLNEYRTMMGIDPKGAVQSLKDAGADIIGANCGNGTAGMIEIVKEIRSIDQDIPVLVHANAGLPIIKNGETCFPENPDDMASQINDLVSAGANIVGGCCGTTPEHIKKIVAVLK
ncbi:homocysteine S-methyltransferase family protein [Bacteroidales bacterium]|nr:homocysteine S-methyltransferase family protein [Bacteroidales bacterium]